MIAGSSVKHLRYSMTLMVIMAAACAPSPQVELPAPCREALPDGVRPRVSPDPGMLKSVLDALEPGYRSYPGVDTAEQYRIDSLAAVKPEGSIEALAVLAVDHDRYGRLVGLAAGQQFKRIGGGATPMLAAFATYGSDFSLPTALSAIAELDERWQRQFVTQQACRVLWLLRAYDADYRQHLAAIPGDRGPFYLVDAYEEARRLLSGDPVLTVLDSMVPEYHAGRFRP